MSKPVATESTEHNESREMSRKRGAGHEGKDEEGLSIYVAATENSTNSTTVSTVPATTDQFMFTPEFRRHFVEFVPGDTLMTLRLATKGWKVAAEAFIDEGVRRDVIIVHDGNDLHWKVAKARHERRMLVTRVIFLLNITQIGERACTWASNLVVVEIPEGIESIGERAFNGCRNLTAVFFLTTLTSIGVQAFYDCTSLDNVNLLHTNLQKLGSRAFRQCSELKSMTIPDSLQKFGSSIFWDCSKIVPSNINVTHTNAVVAYLRSKQKTFPSSIVHSLQGVGSGCTLM
ncbi:hypothetical protein TL16_g05843 [Triparma laevis f. inornata]|uniref:Uncharacterized protein n=1 Tax=Triparma laevis f. inornata TaxID=1714386 RepID=A0A9W7AMN9_9STRA|nr:hypothetical protein TL16_g05843 [Triparma laevis f. inornata]